MLSYSTWTGEFGSLSGKSISGKTRLLTLFAGILGLCIAAEPTARTVAAGAAIVALGEAVRLWAAGHLHKSRILITSGPYRYTRHPMYLGRFLVFSGLAVMAWLPFGLTPLALAAGYLLFFTYYMPRKERVEGARLESLHGAAFRSYRQAVPALFPSRRPYGEDSSKWRAGRFWKNREALTAFGLLAIIGWLAYRALSDGSRL